MVCCYCNSSKLTHSASASREYHFRQIIEIEATVKVNKKHKVTHLEEIPVKHIKYGAMICVIICIHIKFFISVLKLKKAKLWTKYIPLL